jgi:hypothetical protein
LEGLQKGELAEKLNRNGHSFAVYQGGSPYLRLKLWPRL